MTSNPRLLSLIAYAGIFAKTAQRLTYDSVGDEGAFKLQTDAENKFSIAQGLSGISSTFTWPRMYASM